MFKWNFLHTSFCLLVLVLLLDATKESLAHALLHMDGVNLLTDRVTGHSHAPGTSFTHKWGKSPQGQDNRTRPCSWHISYTCIGYRDKMTGQDLKLCQGALVGYLEEFPHEKED